MINLFSGSDSTTIFVSLVVEETVEEIIKTKQNCTSVASLPWLVFNPVKETVLTCK